MDKTIAGIFQAASVQAGDHICLQSSLKEFVALGFTAELVISGLQELVGEEGSIIMPAYNFHSWTEHQFFDILETPSEVGALTEIFRRSAGVKRTKHPIHSLSVWGKLADKLCSVDAVNSFGNDSVFAVMEQENILYMTAGTGLAMPFLPCHYSEFVVGAGYRYEKMFEGNYIDENRSAVVKKYSFDVKKEAFRSLISPVYAGHEELYRSGVVKQIEAGKIILCFARASAYHSAFIQFMKTQPALFKNAE